MSDRETMTPLQQLIEAAKLMLVVMAARGDSSLAGEAMYHAVARAEKEGE